MNNVDLIMAIAFLLVIFLDGNITVARFESVLCCAYIEAYAKAQV
jgi:hypothetical protein